MSIETKVIAAATISIFDVATGLSYETLIAGFAGGLVSLSFLPQQTTWRKIWTPVTATLTAGYTAPVAGHYVGEIFDYTPLTPSDGVDRGLIFFAFAIGLLAQFLIPAVVYFIKSKSGSTTEG